MPFSDFAFLSSAPVTVLLFSSLFPPIPSLSRTHHRYPELVTVIPNPLPFSVTVVPCSSPFFRFHRHSPGPITVDILLFLSSLLFPLLCVSRRSSSLSSFISSHRLKSERSCRS